MLYISPISEEIVEAAHRVATAPGMLGFCASVGQVGPGAYTGFERERFATLRTKFANAANIVLERDHLGRNGENLMEWVEADIEFGFDAFMLHVFEPSMALKVLETFGDNDDYEWQIGPGEDDSRAISPRLWAETADYADWFSFPTGCLIDGLRNKGTLDEGLINDRWAMYNVKIRGHNCDYLPVSKLRRVQSLCDGVNVAPQLGVVQSSLYQMFAVSHGVDVSAWYEACYHDYKNCKRWVRRAGDMPLAVGHYHFGALEDRFREESRELVTRAMEHYIKHLIGGTDVAQTMGL